MLHAIGSCVTYKREAWQVIGFLRGTRHLLSMDGTRRTYAAAIHLTPAP